MHRIQTRTARATVLAASFLAVGIARAQSEPPVDLADEQPAATTSNQPAPSTPPAEESQPRRVSRVTQPGGPTPQQLSRTRRELQFRFGTGASWSSESDLNGAQGGVSIARARAAFGIDVPVLEHSVLRVDFDWEQSLYDFDDATGFGLSDDYPLPNDLATSSIGVSFLHPLSVDLSLLANIEGRYSAEGGADFADSITGRGFVALRYAVNPDLAFNFGLGVRSRLEEDAIILPLIGVDWQFAKDWSVRTDGLGVVLEHDYSDTLRFSLTGSYEFREYRLDTGAILPDGTFTDNSISLLLGADWDATPNVSIIARAGSVLWQEYVFRNDNSAKIADVEGDPSLFFGGGLSIRF
ncbi:MAG: DUF6268 family outer membrane beta-barrel protein [Phycisphaerales bacterium]|jgi:hypothetical protein|nr:DUF6268 family outer membrane beta-barrel protein [Phycisphaerales bacterium]